MTTPGLTVSMIVKDERANLEALLPALIAEVDDVVVVDTGSTDGSVETARSLGARVVQAPWQNDFSFARNRGLDEVRTSHVLWLDADDRIEPQDLGRVRDHALARGNVGLLLLLVNESADPHAVSSCWQLRVFPTDPRHRFAGRVHEQVRGALEATGTPVENFEVSIRHTGYVKPEDVVRKARRNLELLRREIAEGRDDVTVLYHLIPAAQGCGELEEASEAARRCVEDPPPGTPAEIVQFASVHWGRIEYQRGRHDVAERILRDATSRLPNDPLARFLLADLLRRRNDLPGALRELEVARVSPIRNSNLPLPVAGLGRAIRWQLGEVLEMLDRPADAAAIYRECLAQAPDDRSAQLACARASIAAGDSDSALPLLDALVAYDEFAGEILLLRATIAYDAQRDDEARLLFRRAVEMMPRSWAAWLHLGHLSLRRAELTAAREHYERAAALSNQPGIGVGLAAVALEQNRLPEALDLLADVVDGCRTRPLPSGTEAIAGETLLRLGRPQEARGAFEKHLQRYGADARILARLADCYRELGVAEAARVGYAEALKLAPGLPSAVKGLHALSTPN